MIKSNDFTLEICFYNVMRTLKEIINNKNAYFYDGFFPSAKEMGQLINFKYANKHI